jgi:hypothetical protein
MTDAILSNSNNTNSFHSEEQLKTPRLTFYPTIKAEMSVGQEHQTFKTIKFPLSASARHIRYLNSFYSSS